MTKGKGHVADIAFVLSLFCVFVVSALFLVAMGADVYKRISQNMTENYSVRNSVSYISEKVRQHDIAGSVRVDEVEGAPALVLRYDSDEYELETWVYVAGGQLCEVTVRAGHVPLAIEGERIIPMESMALDMNDSGLLEIMLEDTQGYINTASVYLRSAEGSVP